MKKCICLFLCLIYVISILAQEKMITLTKESLRDKIMGGWAGQTIGVTFGGPHEFKFNGTFIADYQIIRWFEGYLKQTMINDPGLYDDLYMDLTFVGVFEKYGLKAPVDSFANAYARASYPLWHANQAGRYNILNGIKAPASGAWKNNPHADCIDYQIEADFAGLMSPGMPNTASAISDKIGHIMNYGDGWYGGVFVGAMYSLAFLSNDVGKVVREALKTIPSRSEFYQCINDVIKWHEQFPTDWKQTWFEVQKKWTSDISCPDGVFLPFNIDAKVNAAYVVIGLLYGGGEFTKTLEITTRCGQDADCNPSSSAGILGTILGYSKIPAYWKLGLKEAELIDFKYTDMSLSEVYETGFRHALQNIEMNGGKINGENISIHVQKPMPVKFEHSFAGKYPANKILFNWPNLNDEKTFEFEGTGFVIRGESALWTDTSSSFVYNMEVYIDERLMELVKLPANYISRRYDLCWNYELPKGKHKVRLKILNPSRDHGLRSLQAIIYSDTIADGIKANEIAAYEFDKNRK